MNIRFEMKMPPNFGNVIDKKAMKKKVYRIVSHGIANSVFDFNIQSCLLRKNSLVTPL